MKPHWQSDVPTWQPAKHLGQASGTITAASKTSHIPRSKSGKGRHRNHNNDHLHQLRNIRLAIYHRKKSQDNPINPRDIVSNIDSNNNNLKPVHPQQTPAPGEVARKVNKIFNWISHPSTSDSKMVLEEGRIIGSWTVFRGAIHQWIETGSWQRLCDHIVMAVDNWPATSDVMRKYKTLIIRNLVLTFSNLLHLIASPTFRPIGTRGAHRHVPTPYWEQVVVK